MQNQTLKTDGSNFIVRTQNSKEYEYKPHFTPYYSSEDMYVKSGIRGFAPMTAKEIETEEQQDIILSDKNYIVEEKFDGTRALLYFLTPNPLRVGSGDPHYVLYHSLLSGSNVEGGKRRIYEFFISHSSNTERVEFLKKEYGIGGFSIKCPNSYTDSINFNPSGYTISNLNVTHTWASVSKAIDELISMGCYYPDSAYTRCFSRRVSEKTGWFCENTDSLPQLRLLNIPELKGTIIDGEMFIPNRPFKDVASTLNCKWDKAFTRQLEIGFIVFHAFDILFYKGVDLRKMPLHRRKVYLQLVIDKINSPYVKMVDFQSCGGSINVTPYLNTHGSVYTICRYLEESGKSMSYPNLYKEYLKEPGRITLSPRAFYEYIVATGGEGVMVKPIDGRYYSKRGREYQKIKKYLTRDVVIMRFNDPTDEYKGKFPTVDKWDYWETTEKDRVDLSECSPAERLQFKKNWYPEECRPISKHYCKYWVGTIRFGVIITPEEMLKLPKNKKFNIEEMTIEGDDVLVLEVGECSGFDEETREMFSEDPKSWIGTVIEVKANEIFKDTGKLRHPRFLRVREDKSPADCTYIDHING